MGKLKRRTVGAFIVLCQFLKLSDAAISFIKVPDKPSYVKKGNNATLVWDYSVTDRQTELKGIIWAVFYNTKLNNLVAEDKNGDRGILPSIPSAYIGRVGIEGRASLVIENITIQDSTTFQCTLRAEPKSGLQDKVSAVNLIVTETPQISIPSIESSYHEGSDVKIICKASGTPDPHVQWIRNGKKITEGKKESHLMFNSLNRTDDGQYTCNATNLAGYDEKDVTLVVNYSPEGTTISTSAANNTVTQGGSVTFTCQVTAAKPQVSQYRFFLNETTLVKDSKDNRYTIDNVQRSEHYGKYKCIPRNDVGNGSEAAVILNVNVPVQFTILPQNLTVNETNPIVVRCDASGFPEPSFTWTKDGKVRSQLKKLNIQRSNRSNAGMYVCTASNEVEQDKTAKAYVTVQFPPTIKEATTSTSKSWIGQTVMLKCVSDGVPTPTLTWYKPDGGQIDRTIDTQSIVNVKMSVDQDFGDYKCNAVNALTPADLKIVKIEQIKKPKPPTIASLLDIQATSLTVKWTAPADDGGSPITAFRVVILKGSAEIKNENVTDPGISSLPVGGLERNTKYTVKVFARNAVFEGPAAEKTVKTKYEGVPAAATIHDLPNEVTDDTITLKWSKPQDNGKVIRQYTVYQRTVTDDKPGEWIELRTITDVSVRKLEVALESGKVYQFVVTATNEIGESLKENGKIKTVKASQKSGGDDGTQTGGGDEGNGMGAAIYAGAAVAGVLLIIGIIVIIILWRRRKPSSDEDTSRDELGGANHYESEDGFHSVSREAAQSLQASGAAAEPDYAQVDQSRKKKNRMPANDEYAQVDKSKKTKKKKKKNPGELEYADLEDLRSDIQLGPVPSGGGAAAAPIVRPPAYEGTVYADISQFGAPQPDPTYANVPKQEVVYSNVESM